MVGREWMAGRHHLWFPMVLSIRLCWVGLCRVLVLPLRGHRWSMGLAHGHKLLRRGTGIQSAAPANIAHAIIGDVVDVGPVDIDIAHARTVHVIDRSVVPKMAALPVAAIVAVADVAEAVVDAAIEADVNAPVTVVPVVAVAVVAPVARRPQPARVGRDHPRSRHPVIARGRIAPIARRP